MLTVSNLWIKNKFQNENRTYLRDWNLDTQRAPPVAVSSVKSLGGPPSTQHPSIQIYIQLLRFIYTQTPLPSSNFLCLRQSSQTLYPFGITLRGTILFKYKGNHAL